MTVAAHRHAATGSGNQLASAASSDASQTLSLSEHDELPAADFTPPRLVLALEADWPLRGGEMLELDGIEELIIGRGSTPGIEVIGRGAGGPQLRWNVCDQRMSRHHLRLQALGEKWLLSDLQSKNGTFVDGTSVTTAAVADGMLIEAGGVFFVFRGARAGCPAPPVAPVLGAFARDDEPLGQPLSTYNPDLAAAFAQLRRIAGTDLAVLVSGETGTGKELVAKAIHALSGRAGRFVAVNCGALPGTLIESELFGYRRGAFSGAAEDREGLVRSADGGTLFLDEVAEMPATAQVKLLRVLQEREVRPVGGLESVPVNARVIAATHADLTAQMEKGLFRPDLFARLRGHQLELPPLRARREDLGQLAAVSLRRHGAGVTPRLSVAAARLVMSYDYPLNIRELDQALHAALALAETGRVRSEHLPATMRASARDAGKRMTETERALRTVLIARLEEHDGNVSAVARSFEKAPVQIRRWCRRFGIEVHDFRQTDRD